MKYFTEEWIQGFAKGAGWKGMNGSDEVRVEYHMASNEDSKVNMNFSNVSTGVIVFGACLWVAYGFVGLGTIVELTKIGDKTELKEKEKAEILHEASKYRRISQYNSVML